jgi:hypothetical protein
MQQNKNIFSNFAETVIPKLKEVAGRFGNSIEYKADDNVLIIWGSPFISVLWKGRRPTTSGAKKGNPTLQQIIRKWIDEKGIVPYNEISRDSLAFLITRSIHQKGTLLYQQGGKENPFNKVLTDESINNLLSLLTDKYYSEVIKSIE